MRPTERGEARPSPQPGLIIRRRAALAVMLLIAGIGCGQDQRSREVLPAQASLWLEEAPAGIGEPFEVVLIVRSPSDHRVVGYEMPEFEGIELLGRQIDDAEPAGAVTLHRERLRVRAERVGRLAWPESRTRLTRPDGAIVEIATPGLEIDVRSSTRSSPDDPRPHGYRSTRSAASGGVPWAALLVGLFAGAGLVLAGMRLRSRPDATAEYARIASQPAHSAPERSDTTHSTRTAQLRDEITRAQATQGADAEDAAQIATLALRRWAAHRFVAPTHALSGHELLDRCPPGVAHADWRAWVELVIAFEEDRFAANSAADRAREIAVHLDRAGRFADSVSHPEIGRPSGAASTPARGHVCP